MAQFLVVNVMIIAFLRRMLGGEEGRIVGICCPLLLYVFEFAKIYQIGFKFSLSETLLPILFMVFFITQKRMQLEDYSLYESPSIQHLISEGNFDELYNLLHNNLDPKSFYSPSFGYTFFIFYAYFIWFLLFIRFKYFLQCFSTSIHHMISSIENAIKETVIYLIYYVIMIGFISV